MAVARFRGTVKMVGASRKETVRLSPGQERAGAIAPSPYVVSSTTSYGRIISLSS
jgi:hypothetical protein